MAISSSALETAADCRSASSSRAFSNATAACAASSSSSRTESVENWFLPSFDSTITPIVLRSKRIGTATIDSSMSSVPSTSSANSQSCASPMFSVWPRSAAVPVIPSPISQRSASNVCPAYSLRFSVPPKATGSRVRCPSSR